jgi:hypothetical protein
MYQQSSVVLVLSLVGMFSWPSVIMVNSLM